MNSSSTKTCLALIATLCTLVCSCRNTPDSTLLINCAPQQLPDGEWAVLLIAQDVYSGETPVQLNTKSLSDSASLAMLMDIRRPGRGAAPSRETVVYHIKPLPGASLTLGPQHFLNLPPTYSLVPVTLTSQATTKNPAAPGSPHP